MAAFLAGDLPWSRSSATSSISTSTSHDNLPAGTRGSSVTPDVPGAVIEVTEQLHAGCPFVALRRGRRCRVNGKVGRPVAPACGSTHAPSWHRSMGVYDRAPPRIPNLQLNRLGVLQAGSTVLEDT